MNQSVEVHQKIKKRTELNINININILNIYKYKIIIYITNLASRSPLVSAINLNDLLAIIEIGCGNIICGDLL